MFYDKKSQHLECNKSWWFHSPNKQNILFSSMELSTNQSMSTIFQLQQMRLVVSRLVEAMNVLHEHDLVHGCLDTNLVSLDIVDGVNTM